MNKAVKAILTREFDVKPEGGIHDREMLRLIDDVDFLYNSQHNFAELFHKIRIIKEKNPAQFLVFSMFLQHLKV
jgi:hypothetical protein